MNEDAISWPAVRHVLKDYTAQYRRHPWATGIAFLFPAIGTTFVYFVPPLIIAGLVDLIAKGAEVTLTTVGTQIALFGLLWLLGEGFWRVGMHALVRLETAALRNLGRGAFNSLMDRDYTFYTNNFVGSLTKKGAAYLRNFIDFTDTLTFHVFDNVLPVFFALYVLAQYSLWLPLLLLGAIALVVLIAIPIIRRRSKLVAARHVASSKVSGRLSDVITNILTVKSFAKEESEALNFGATVDNYAQKFQTAALFQNHHYELVVSPLYVLTNVLGLVAAIYLIEQMSLPASALVIIFSYYALVTRIFWEINRMYRNLESSVSEAAEFAELMLAPSAVRDSPHATELEVADATISYKSVRFHYASGTNDEPFLDDFNLEIRGGERIGLVGPSGGGKTTITKLLLRFLDLQGGVIEIDGQSIQTVSQRSLRNAIAYVPQEPLLFHRSLFENIAYGNESAGEAEVIRAAELAHADEFIRVLPDKYNTLVGERGIKLSGGQRQRVAIARAMLRQAPILVLDEATSSLDSESEKYIQAGLWELMKNKTALVIAHRLSTIKHLDRIIVLEKGKIVQTGTHEELINYEGLYARLWQHQSGGFLEE